MRIVNLVKRKLFVFHHDGKKYDEFEKLMNLWTDVQYLYKFAKQNQIENIDEFIDGILENTEQIQDFVRDLEQGNTFCKNYFIPLQNSEYGRILPLQKGKIEKNRLRLYAIKIDDECYVITGGAIKMSQKMQDHPDTAQALKKLKNARSYLHQNDVFDNSSFNELVYGET